jgi:hypothetical protein
MIAVTMTALLCACCFQVGLSSGNDAVVGACVRVLAALLQAALGLRSLSQPSSEHGLAGPNSWEQQQHSQQDRCQQQQHSPQNAQIHGIAQPNRQQQEPQQQLSSDAGQPYDDEQLQLQTSSSSSTCSWQELLQLLLAAAGEPSRSAAVRAAALQELRQLLLQLADALSVPNLSPASPSAAVVAEAVAAQAGDENGKQSIWSSSKVELAAARDALLPGVLPLALAALQEEAQELRRWGGGLAGRLAMLHV